MSRTALLAGATGLVGAALLPRLLADPGYTRIVVPTRRPLPLADPKLEIIVGDFEDPRCLGPALAVDDLFCCLGTTTRKAGGGAGLERIDRTLVVNLARAVRQRGASRLFVVSAAGAGVHAGSHYARVKGRMEREVAVLGFDTVQILRPSLLLGARSESRPAEALAQRLAPMMAPLCIGPLKKYRPVPASAVAEALHRLAQQGVSGVAIHHLPLPPADG